MPQATSTARRLSARDVTPSTTYARPPYRLAILAGVLVFVLYALTLAPTTAFWDTSEYIATAHNLGIPHPPGNPLFVLMARAWELLLTPTGLATAVRINLFSALMGSGAALFWYLVVHRIISFLVEDERVRRVGAGVSVLVSATAYTVWNQSNVNEKVYTVSLLTIALLSWVGFLWRDHVEQHQETSKGRWHDDNALVFVAFVLALSVGNHLMAFLAAPALLLLFWMVKREVFLNWRMYLWSAVFAVVGLSVHLYLPLRARLHPVINEADPTCQSMGSALESVLTFGKAGCVNLSASLAREQYAKPPVTDRLAPFGAQLANYFQYFDWQWSRSIMGGTGYFGIARLPFTLLFLALGAYGAWRHLHRDRTSFAYMAALFVTLSVGLIFYLNFKYGFGQASANGLGPEVGEVRERDYFFLVSFSIWGLWAGVGLTALWMRLTETIGTGRDALLKSSPILLVAFIPLVLNWPYASRAHDYAARDWAYNLLMSVEPYGVLFTNGDNDTFPLWYVQEVEGVRRDVTVIVWSYLNTPWYAKQIRSLTTPCAKPGDAEVDPTRTICQREFHPAGAPADYRGAHYPTRTILPLTDAEIDAATAYGYIQLPSAVAYDVQGIRTTFPAGATLPAADQFILSIIKQSLGDRPIYFAATTNAHRSLGIDKFVVRQGVAYKLLTPAQTTAPGIVPMPQDQEISPVFGQYLDVPRTEELMSKVFVFRDLVDRSHWTDDATRGIPTYYGYVYASLATAEQKLGHMPTAQAYAKQFQKWMDMAMR